MTRLMKDEFIKNLNSLSWMSESTKAMAKQKVYWRIYETLA